MEQFKTYKVLFALILLHINIKAFAVQPNFQHARQLIIPPINYDTFCVEKPEGKDKIACRIRNEQTVGFIVCKASIFIDGTISVPCRQVIADEIVNLKTLRAAQIRTVTFSEPQINGVNCRDKPNELCSGFLEEWVGNDRGRFKHIRNRISYHTVQGLIQEVKSFTPQLGLVATVANLRAIRNYMHMVGPPPSYRQICDLQGFFLIEGGF
ncbi:hypothetical protein OS493_035599 [Desmophyllum pertusum]|uniref:Uncharacterized protein n=1 Tax=Desmophyllum pertusum TaxID=174260 RepID=A0A9W9ZIJ2_9CNID|nr:hypothetical protein OS493_035599 [Desmophyllum pertusum]